MRAASRALAVAASLAGLACENQVGEDRRAEPSVGGDVPPAIAGEVQAAVAPPATIATATPIVAAPSAATAAPSSPSAVSEPSVCPPEMAHIGKYCIDRWEAHLLLDEGGKPTRHPHHARPASGAKFRAASAAGVLPQAYLSREEARAACRHAGKRLCSWIEWRRACQGPKWLRYPYGNTGKKGACNTGRDHLLAKLHGDDPRLWTLEQFNDPDLNREPGYLAATGIFDLCVSAEGLHDMVGNLHEWVDGMVTKSFMKKLESERVERDEQPWAVGNGMFLGGFYSTTSEHGPGCHFTTVAHEPGYHDYSTGFRCCANANH